MAADIPGNLYSWSATAGGNQPDTDDPVGPNSLAQNLQVIQSVVRNLHSSDTIASAGTTDIGTKEAEVITVTGTTTITSLGTVSAGIRKKLIFAGVLTFTHNATSLILPGAANITTAAGDTCEVLSLGSGNWRCMGYQPADGYPILPATVAALSANTFTGLQNWAAGADIASAGTLDLTAATGNTVHITGTTTTTAITLNAGEWAMCIADGAWPLTYHASNLKLNTGVSYTCNAGDRILFFRDNASVVHGIVYPVATKEAVWIPAAAMTPRSTNGAARGLAETTTNDIMIETLDFDTATVEYAQFAIRMPPSWDEGTVTFIPVWSHAATTTNFGVVWSLAGLALSDDDAMDTALGTAQTSTDTGGTTNDLYIGPVSSAITLAGTPAAGDLAILVISRTVGDAGDTMAIDARLHGIYVLFGVANPVTDA